MSLRGVSLGPIGSLSSVTRGRTDIVWLASILLCLAIIGGLPALAQAKYASIVVDFKSGRVLHEVNADTRNYPASLTKMMTLYMTFDALSAGRLSLTQRLKVSRRAAGMPASKLGLRSKQTISVEQAILALVTKSANDAAVVLAEALGGSESKFAVMMTKRAHQLGMTSTTFKNASGLPNRGQLSTARDMATLARRLIRDHPKYYGYFSTRSFSYNNLTYRNHNRLLKTYKGADGIKTGYIRASGFNLAASAIRHNRRLVAVVFGGKTSRSRDRHIAKLLDRGFQMAGTVEPLPLLTPPPRKPSVVNAAYRPAEAQEATKAAAPAPTPKVTVNGRWGVQVGAFYKEAPARDAARQAAKQLPDLLGQAAVMTPTIRGQKGNIYRARLMGLSERSARTACKQLKSARIDCLVVRLPKNMKLAQSAAPSG